MDPRVAGNPYATSGNNLPRLNSNECKHMINSSAAKVFFHCVPLVPSIFKSVLAPVESARDVGAKRVPWRSLGRTESATGSRAAFSFLVQGMVEASAPAHPVNPRTAPVSKLELEPGHFALLLKIFTLENKKNRSWLKKEGLIQHRQLWGQEQLLSRGRGTAGSCHAPQQFQNGSAPGQGSHQVLDHLHSFCGERACILLSLPGDSSSK